MPAPRLRTLLCTLIFSLYGLSSFAQTWQWETDSSTYIYEYTQLDSHSSTISAAYAVLPDRAVLAKRDKYGNLIWSRQMVSTSGASVNSIQGDIALDNRDNIYFITKPIATIDNAAVNTPGPYALVKFNSNGRFLWARALNDTATIPLMKIVSSGDRLFISVGYNAFTNLTFNGTVYPYPGGNTHCNLIAALDTSGNTLWAKRLFTQANVTSCDAIDAAPTISVNADRALLLTGWSTDKLWVESTVVVDAGSSCTSFPYGMVLDGNTGNIDWARQLPLDSLAHKANTFQYDRHYLNTMLPDGRSIVYRCMTNDTLLGGVSNNTYSVQLSNKLYQFDRNGNLTRKDSLGTLREWYEMFFLRAGDSSQFFTSGLYHNNLLPSYSIYEFRKWDTTVRAIWTKRLDYLLYFPEFDPSWEFNYRAKALAVILQSKTDGSNPLYRAYFGNNSFVPYGQIILARMVEGANFISGRVFFDLNKNGIQESNEPIAPGVMIGSSNGDTVYTFSNSNGIYDFIVDPGSYAFKPLNLATAYPHYSIASPALQTATVAGDSNFIRNKDFALQANADVTDGAISVTSEIVRYRRLFNIHVVIRNTGTTNIGGSYRIKFDSTQLGLYSSDSTFLSIDTGVITFPLATLPPFGQAFDNLTFVFRADDTAGVGDTLRISGQLLLNATDANPADNIDSAVMPIKGSYDPNEKQAYPFRDLNYDSAVAGRQEIDYIIHFQNTGNDTAFTVLLLDSLDKRLNPATFRLISSSHPVDIDWQQPRTLSFYFKNIHLPDSTRDEPKSHGFVRFRIKPIPTVTLSDTIKNMASIYFDYNNPVLTNTALSNFLRWPAPPVVTATNNVTESSRYLAIRPNPVANILYFELDRTLSERMSLGIYDAGGRRVFSDSRLVVGDREDGVDVSFLEPGVYYFILQDKKDTYIKSFIRL